MLTGDSTAEFQTLAIYLSIYLHVCHSVCLHVHQKIGLTQVWLPCLSFLRLSEFFFPPLYSRPAHWRKRTRDDGHCLFFTILFMSHNSSVYLSVPLRPLCPSAYTEPRQALLCLLHGPLLPAQTHTIRQAAASLIKCMGLWAWIAHSPPRKSISP